MVRISAMSRLATFYIYHLKSMTNLLAVNYHSLSVLNQQMDKK